MLKMTALLNVALKCIFLQHPCRIRYDWSNNCNLATVGSIELASSWRRMKGREWKTTEDAQYWIPPHIPLQTPGFLSLVLEYRAPPPSSQAALSLPCPPPLRQAHFPQFETTKFLRYQGSASLLGNGERTSYLGKGIDGESSLVNYSSYSRFDTSIFCLSGKK